MESWRPPRRVGVHQCKREGSDGDRPPGLVSLRGAPREQRDCRLSDQTVGLTRPGTPADNDKKRHAFSLLSPTCVCNAYATPAAVRDAFGMSLLAHPLG